MDRLTLEIRNLRSFTGTPAELNFSAGGFTSVIGMNNSGKSSLLRMFWELRPVLKAIYDLTLSPASRNTLALLSGQGQSVPPPSKLPGERIFPTANTSNPEITIVFEDSPFGPDDPLWPQAVALMLQRDGTLALRIEMRRGAVLTGQSSYDPGVRGQGIRALTYRIGHDFVDLTLLRDALAVISDSMYIGPFRNAINVGANSNYFDLMTGDQFISALNAMKSGSDPESNEAVFNMTDELRRIFTFSSLEINPAPDYHDIQLNVNGTSYRSSELGSGLMHFLLTSAMVLRHKPALLLIDEPELNLHPALQLDFLTLLGSYATFATGFATHSLGLARTAADHLYAVTRTSAGVSTCFPYEDTPELASLIGQLGYTGFNDFQFDGLLLVEGITDVRTFLQLLRLYGREHSYVVIPLGGQAFLKKDVAVELGELRRLSRSIFAIIDSERTASDMSPDRGRLAFSDAIRRIGGRCHILERRSIESYLPDHAVKKVYGQDARSLAPYESTKDVSFGWSKQKNWKVARESRRADFEDTDLGRFFEALSPS